VRACLLCLSPSWSSPKVRKDFFFEKKQQKTFAQLASAFPQRLSLNLSKFFGSFFKKEPLALPLAFGGGHLHTWAVTKKLLLILAPVFPERLSPVRKSLLLFFKKRSPSYPPIIRSDGQ
jgi:hypothetical protein